jgi:putative ABC transport system permease protein
VERSVRVKANDVAATARLVGTTASFVTVRRFALRSGRFFDDDDDRHARRVVVLGARVADALFDDGDAVGRRVRVRGVPFDVIGVLAPKGALADGDEDNQALVPVRTALRRVFNTTWLSAIFVSVRDPRAVADAERDVGATLDDRHRAARGAGGRDFEVQNTTKFYELQRRTADALGRLTTWLAAIALVVGGTGIMALMLLSVRERTGEIGLRIAVGARPRDVLAQFLVEATALALGGWLVGVALGAAGAGALAAATSWRVATPWPAVLVSLGTALAVGLGFGAVPARRASLVPPMRALLTT